MSIAAVLDVLVGMALAAAGAWFAFEGTAHLLRGAFWPDLAGRAVGWGLAGMAIGTLLVWTGIALWRGSAWARWPTALVALGFVPGALFLALLLDQALLLALILAGPLLAIGLFLPAARRHVGTAHAEPGPA